MGCHISCCKVKRKKKQKNNWAIAWKLFEILILINLLKCFDNCYHKISLRMDKEPAVKFNIEEIAVVIFGDPADRWYIKFKQYYQHNFRFAHFIVSTQQYLLDILVQKRWISHWHQNMFQIIKKS